MRRFYVPLCEHSTIATGVAATVANQPSGSIRAKRLPPKDVNSTSNRAGSNQRGPTRLMLLRKRRNRYHIRPASKATRSNNRAKSTDNRKNSTRRRCDPRMSAQRSHTGLLVNGHRRRRRGNGQVRHKRRQRKSFSSHTRPNIKRSRTRRNRSSLPDTMTQHSSNSNLRSDVRMNNTNTSRSNTCIRTYSSRRSTGRHNTRHTRRKENRINRCNNAYILNQISEDSNTERRTRVARNTMGRSGRRTNTRPNVHNFLLR